MIIITNINNYYLSPNVKPPRTSHCGAAPSGFLASWMVPAEQHEHGGVDGDVIQTLEKMTRSTNNTIHRDLANNKWDIYGKYMEIPSEGLQIPVIQQFANLKMAQSKKLMEP